MFEKSDKKKCPMLNKSCIESDCMFWVHMYGRDGNSDKLIDIWDCSFRWMPSLMTEIRGATDQVSASVQSLRNETVKRHDLMLGLAASKVEHELIERAK